MASMIVARAPAVRPAISAVLEAGPGAVLEAVVMVGEVGLASEPGVEPEDGPEDGRENGPEDEPKDEPEGGPNIVLDEAVCVGMRRTPAITVVIMEIGST